jgi:hypothetical protein
MAMRRSKQGWRVVIAVLVLTRPKDQRSRRLGGRKTRQFQGDGVECALMCGMARRELSRSA